MMDYKKFKLIQQYNRVVLWNNFAGKNEFSNWENQADRVKEEIKEFFSHTQIPLGNDFDRKNLVLDDVCDIFVTASFLDYMNQFGKGCSLYYIEPHEDVIQLVKSGNIHEVKPFFTDIEYSLGVVYSIIMSGSDEYDFLGAIEEVIDSNYSKYIPYGANTLLKSALEEFESNGEDVYVVDSNLYHVIKRKSDDKVMKPTVCYREPLLDKFIKKV